MLIIIELKKQNRNKKCYDNRNKKCYDLQRLTTYQSSLYGVDCYDLLRQKTHLSRLIIRQLAMYRNKKIVTKKNRFEKTLLKAKSTGDVYEYLGKNQYKNLSKGQLGHIDRAIVNKHLSIPVRANQLQMKNRHFVTLIEALGLSIID